MWEKVLMPRKIQSPTAKPRWAFPQTQSDAGMDATKMNGADIMGLGLYQTFPRSFSHLLLKVTTVEWTAQRELLAVQPRGNCTPTLFLLFLVFTSGENEVHGLLGRRNDIEET